ncbi:uncharacterized protein [Ptychodera flava]|uniref:uncharacterized protein n=1 Tax=Ptychodera flava TaxID=63121 RepID=UPI00396A4A8E
MKSKPSWVTAHNEIKQLADCLASYQQHLDHQNSEMKKNQSLEHPVRPVSENATVEHRPKVSFLVKEKYRLLDTDVKAAGLSCPVFFDEEKHLSQPFQNPMQKHRYLTELQVSVPIDIYRYCPGGSCLTSVCIVQVPEGRSDVAMLTESARMMAKIKGRFKEYHTRSQRKLFRKRLNNITGVLPSVADFIYKELALDASTASHPETQQRLRLIFLGEKGLVADLRHLNAGRPTGTYDVFFEKLAELVENVTAADERRHNTAHLSEWISLKEMMKQAQDLCPENTPVPSKSLVRLQFAPRNPYTHAALNFTSRIQVQYKIQRRQLRVEHPDDHYCAAIFKYLKNKATELKDRCVMFCCDDKAKVPFGEPGHAVSTGVRGKKTITPTGTTLCALDHDMTKASLTPSVILQCTIPENVEKSFVRGKVTTVVNDSVFQQSTPFRHAAQLTKIFRQHDIKSTILLKYSDGGTDHRNTLESVKCAAFCMFRELDLDMLILARCAPGQSWTNPAERVMSILNLGLQNCSLERRMSDDKGEANLKKCGSMADIRERSKKQADLRDKWVEVVEPLQSLVRNRFTRLKLKEEAIQAMDPVADVEIDHLKQHLQAAFPDLATDKLQKAHTQKVKSYTSWMDKHSRQRQYCFQIRKCDDTMCCTPKKTVMDDLEWLPDPVLQENGEHYKQYSEVKGTDTTENDRPSLTVTKVSKQRSSQSEVPQSESESVSVQRASPQCSNITFSAQTARASLQCVECRKPRVIYAKTKLSQTDQIKLAILMSENDYTCGAELSPPDHRLHEKVALRPHLSCAVPVEIPYYGADVGQKDVCAHCGCDEAQIDAELKKQYKTVLPMCNACHELGKMPITYRPFGKK